MRDLYLSDAKSVSRKIKEILLALEVTRDYTKDEILTAYLSEVYFGNGAYGVGEAADIYFGTNVQNLDLAQRALLAGLPQAPSYDDPLLNLRAAIARQRVVLQTMADVGDITQAEA